MTTMWHERWQEQKTAWDLNGPHPLTLELLSFVCSLGPMGLGRTWMIPGCGRAHDAVELLRQGISSVVAKDLVPLAIEEAKRTYPDLKGLSLECGDVCKVDDSEIGKYDGIFDRAMLCALSGDFRLQYVRAIEKYLRPGGVFASIPFTEISEPEVGPPFSISGIELVGLFGPGFKIVKNEPRISPACGQKLLKEGLFIAIKRP